MSAPHSSSRKASTAKPRTDKAFRLYGMGETAAVLGVSQQYIRTVKEAGAPFPLGRTRPEWILEWLKDHADDERMKGTIEGS